MSWWLPTRKLRWGPCLRRFVGSYVERRSEASKSNEAIGSPKVIDDTEKGPPGSGLPVWMTSDTNSGTRAIEPDLFRVAAATLTDFRFAPDIPPSAVFLAAFHGFVFRLPSFQQLEAELTQP